MTVLLEQIARTLLGVSLLTSAYLYLQKDVLPDASFYDLGQLQDPVQTRTHRDSFTTRAGGQEYLIKPLYDYDLNGVIVSYHDADSFTDIWHHDRWLDFINLRDLCVVWGSNVGSGVYQDMDFKNGSWTCWYRWPNGEVRDRFDETRLSNNHVLIDDEGIKNVLMQSEPGDQIRLKGMLVEYSNPGNGFNRGTSTNRTDTGNGACETIYVDQFEVIKKANPGLRYWYSISSWITIISLIATIVLFFITPYRGRYQTTEQG